MTEHHSNAALAQIALTAPSSSLPNRAERVFGLPPILFALTVGAYVAFLAILGAAFMNANLAIPFAIFAIYLAMAFGVPSLWTRIAPEPVGRPQRWDEFLREGMTIQTGEISGAGVVAQVLTLPALVVVFALAVAAIAASV